MHEASHAAALILAGMTPLCCRVDQPAPDRLGGTAPDWESHNLSARNLTELLLSVIIAPLFDGDRIDETWPPNFDAWSEASGADAEQAAFLVDLLGLDRIGWLQVVTRAQRRGREQRFRELVVEIARELERVELLTQPELDRIAAPILGATA